VLPWLRLARLAVTIFTVGRNGVGEGIRDIAFIIIHLCGCGLDPTADANGTRIERCSMLNACLPRHPSRSLGSLRALSVGVARYAILNIIGARLRRGA
jgi:hypothetical protein